MRQQPYLVAKKNCDLLHHHVQRSLPLVQGPISYKFLQRTVVVFDKKYAKRTTPDPLPLKAHIDRGCVVEPLSD